MAGFIAGSMFVFIDASREDPLEAVIDGERVILGCKGIFSRYASDITVGHQRIKRLSIAAFNPITLFTPYKNYRPEEEVPISVIAPLSGGEEVDLELIYNGQPFREFRERLDENGCLLKALRPGLEGKWQVKATMVDMPSVKALGEFEISGYTLSVLRAQIQFQTYEERAKEINFTASIDLLGQPYHGPLRVDIQCGFCHWRVIAEIRDMMVNEGTARGTFHVSSHTGPFLLVLSTPEGHTASLLLQQSARERRELKPLSTLGCQYEMSLMPLAGSQEIRGIHILHKDSETSPFVMREVIGNTLEIDVTKDVSITSVVTVNPITQGISVKEYQGIKKGSLIQVKTEPPYTPIMIGSHVDGCPYEAWGIGLSPLELKIELGAPRRIRASESLPLEITTSKKARVLLVVGDPRLLRAAENPCLNLSASLFKSMVETVRDWKKQVLQIRPGRMELPSSAWQFGERSASRRLIRSITSDIDIPSFLRRRDIPSFLRRRDISSLRMAPGISRGIERHSSVQDIEDYRNPHYGPAFTAVGEKEDPVLLPDIAPLREEGTAPLLYCQFLEVDGRVIYRTEDLAQVTISTPNESISYPVLPGQGVLNFSLHQPGLVMAGIEDAKGEIDAVEKTIHAPLQRRVWVSEIKVLGRGERVEAPSVVIFPGYSPLLQDTVEGILHYPYGCNEQISAQIGAVGVVYRGAKKGIFNGDGGDRMSRAYEIIQTGLRQLRAKNPGVVRLWPLWPRGNPDVRATIMIARNLIPLMDDLEEFPMTYDILEGIKEGLLKTRVKDASLIPLDSYFYSGKSPETVEEAVFSYVHLSHPKVKDRCLAYIRETAQILGEKAYWKNTRVWGGPLEATCCAAQALYLAEDPLMEKAFRYISGHLQGRTLFSTRDTIELIKLLNLMAAHSRRNGKPMIIIDGKEAVLDRTLMGQKLEVKDGQVIARVEHEEIRDLKKIKSNFPLRVEIDNPSPKLGEKVKIIIRAEKEVLSPLAYIDLPPMLAAIRFGAQVQRLCLPVEYGSLVLEAVAIRRGMAHLWVGLGDMYDAELWGTAPGIRVVV